ncbi:hypothetical protein WICPIJ_005856 [Wickerhamomyces pijperi]|uniref:Ubiquitin carboxyl-terminal hydrolase n=1 Tax=Wickerhamomyces pijperi TaxID=599730 RepID=A0A9P8Q5G7_WICPI|nr:hypothetical protein WICPIJ_005856 [Wickerhamomyces pijperi]
MSSSGWNTIESDPGVFTELVERFGVEGVEFEELYTFDEDTLRSLQPLYGVIFLFKYTDLDQSTIGPVGGGEFDHDSSIFFAKQMIQNACATQAVLNILFNKGKDVKLGPLLGNFKEFVESFDPELKGEAITNSAEITDVHNSFSSPNPFFDENQNKPKSLKDDDSLFHFIGFVRANDKLIELDGLKPYPIAHCECLSDDQFVSKLPQVINQRIMKYGGELRFSMLAMMKDRRDILKDFGDDEGLVNELEKRERWTRENKLRRADLIGLVNQTLRVLAEQKSTEEWNDMLKTASDSSISKLTRKAASKGYQS